MKRTVSLLPFIVILLVSFLSARPASALNIIVRTRGTTGTEQIRLTINDAVVKVWTLTTDFADYNACYANPGTCKVKYVNDGDDPGKDVQVDYIIVDGIVLEAEDQEINTGVWQNEQCGGSYSEWMNCNGLIDFGYVENLFGINVIPSSITVGAEANSTGTFDINSNTNWTVSSNQTWLAVNPTSGSGDDTVTVTAQENGSTSPRTATVTVSAPCINPKTVTVTQGPVLSVLPRWLVVAAEANVARSLDIYSSRSWTVASDQNWLTIDPESGSGNGTVTLTAEENTAPSTRSAIVTVSVPGASQTATAIQMNPSEGDCNVVPPMPPYSVLLDNPKFPDPFVFMDGTRVTTKAQWKCRRAEIAAQVQEFELGYMQYTPYSATTGAMNGNSITVTVTDGNTISFSCSISYPTGGSPPYPAMIGCGFSTLNNSVLSSLGVAVITFPTDQIAQQTNAGSRGTGMFYDMYGSGHSAGALMAWAWGVDRLIDALEKTPTSNIDPTRLGVTGCSRWGKGALICGAFCDRIKLTIPVESGSGGAASWRVSDWQMAQGTQVQTLSQIVTENCWFRANFNQFSSTANKLPFDHHMVAALCAPDALLFIENTSMVWLGNISTWTNGNVTHKIWESLGIPDRMGFSQVGHSDHCTFPSSQQPEVTAYIQKFLIGGGTADTNVMKTDGGLTYNEALWVDWTVPDLESEEGDFQYPIGVEFMDFAVLADAWLSEPMQSNWDPRCDIAEPANDFIDFFDFGKFSENWLQGIIDRRQ